MRDDEPSLTARAVVVARSLIERIPWPSGDADADDRLAAGVIGDPLDAEGERVVRGAGRVFSWVAARTEFFDAAVTGAIDDGIGQIVVLGAGYDGRAVRYATPGVRFFEVDHPATQADKRSRYEAVGAPVAAVAFVGADFTKPGLGDALAAAGHAADRRTLFMCEGVLRYLPADAVRELLAAAAGRAAPGSRLATTFSTRDGAPSAEERAREEALAAAGEPVLTVPARAVALEWVEAAGWSIETVDDPLAAFFDGAHAALLVRARR